MIDPVCFRLEPLLRRSRSPVSNSKPAQETRRSVSIHLVGTLVKPEAFLFTDGLQITLYVTLYVT